MFFFIYKTETYLMSLSISEIFEPFLVVCQEISTVQTSPKFRGKNVFPVYSTTYTSS